MNNDSPLSFPAGVHRSQPGDGGEGNPGESRTNK